MLNYFMLMGRVTAVHKDVVDINVGGEQLEVVVPADIDTSNIIVNEILGVKGYITVKCLMVEKFIHRFGYDVEEEND